MLLAATQFRSIFMFIPMLIAIVPWIIMLIAAWRAMKAHESIAESLRHISQKDQRI